MRSVQKPSSRALPQSAAGRRPAAREAQLRSRPQRGAAGKGPELFPREELPLSTERSSSGLESEDRASAPGGMVSREGGQGRKVKRKDKSRYVA